MEDEAHSPAGIGDVWERGLVEAAGRLDFVLDLPPPLGKLFLVTRKFLFLLGHEMLQVWS